MKIDSIIQKALEGCCAARIRSVRGGINPLPRAKGRTSSTPSPEGPCTPELRPELLGKAQQEVES